VAVQDLMIVPIHRSAGEECRSFDFTSFRSGWRTSFVWASLDRAFARCPG